MRINSISDLIAEAKKVQKKTIIAVIEAQDEHTIQSVVRAHEDGIADTVLIGDAKEIRRLLLQCTSNLESYEVLQSKGAQDSARLAARLVKAGRASAIMKGKLESGNFIRAILDKENDLLTGRILSLAGLFAPPLYHKVFAVSDMGLVPHPDLLTKKAIIENSVRLLNTLGIPRPKVAVLTAVEKPSPKMPETIDADALKKMNENNEIVDCVVEGPISFDLATSKEAAEIKEFDSPVAGDADLLIVANVLSGNILAKCLTGFSGAQTAGTILGAKVPIIFTSRSAETTDKYNSIALATCLS